MPGTRLVWDRNTVSGRTGLTGPDAAVSGLTGPDAAVSGLTGPDAAVSGLTGLTGLTGLDAATCQYNCDDVL